MKAGGYNCFKCGSAFDREYNICYVIFNSKCEISFPVTFKDLLKTFKSINDMGAEYLYEIPSIRKANRKLRSPVRYSCSYL